MTAPIIIRREGLGKQIQEAFSPLLNALAQRQQFGLQRQQLDIERQKAEASIAQAGAATAESRGRTKKLLEELKQKDIELRASDAASERFIATLTSPDGLTPENISAAREELIRKGDKEISSEALVAFDALITANTEQERRQAQAALAASQARVAEATEEDVIAAGQQADELVLSEIAQREAATRASEAAVGASEAAAAASRADTRLTVLQEERDPNRVAKAQALWMTGNVTWKQAREAAGLAPGGIPDDEVFDPAAAKAATGSGGEDARKSARFAIVMATTGPIINQLEAETGGIKGLAFLTREIDQPLFIAIANARLSSKQQQLVAAYRAFGDAFRFWVSGQQSSDREARRMLRTIAGNPGDSKETLKQKRLLRGVIQQAALDAGSGLISPIEAMDEIIAQARLQGMSPDKIAVFQNQRRDAVKFMSDRAAGRGPLILNEDPTTADSLGASTATIDSLMNARFEVRR